MFIINISFAEENANVAAVTDWLKNVGLPIASNDESGVVASKLLKIVAVPGDPEFLNQGANLSLQLEFADRAGADAWMEDYFSPLLEGYADTFERQPLCFATILEQL